LLDYGRLRRAVDAVLEGREPQTRVSAVPARLYVGRLLAAGWSQRRIALAAHVATGTVHELLDGRRTLSMAVDRRLRSVGR
jgi:hypothetical protein